jgi:MarR family transcriptional regulator for hemolysin
MQIYDYENSLGFIVNRAAKAFVKALDSELRKKVGLTVGQWKVMVILVNQNGLTQREIAEKLALEGPTLIPIIDKMEKDGLLIRKVDPNDRRNNRIYRTEKADALWNNMIECGLKIREVSVKGIPDENVKIMKDALEKMWQNLRLNFNVDCSTITDNTITAISNSTTTAKAPAKNKENY